MTILVDLKLRCSTSFESEEELEEFKREASFSDWVEVSLLTQDGIGSRKSGGLNEFSTEVTSR